MNRLALLVLKLQSRAARAAYLRRERRLARQASESRALDILFSRREPWEKPIREGFRGLAHRLTFADIAASDLERFDLIVPLSLDDIGHLRAQATHLQARVVPLPGAACSALCHDKPRLNQQLIDAGFAAHVPAMGLDVPPPYFCKPALGENSDDCLLVADRAAELRMGQALKRPDLFRQAAVPGHVEYATHFLVCDGALARELTVRYHHETAMFIKGAAQAGLQARTLGACPDLTTLRRMLAAIGYDGLGCANYKMERGVLKLLEINPRMGGSLCDYFFSFLRSMPTLQRGARRGRANRSGIHSAAVRPSVGGG